METVPIHCGESSGELPIVEMCLKHGNSAPQDYE